MRRNLILSFCSVVVAMGWLAADLRPENKNLGEDGRKKAADALAKGAKFLKDSMIDGKCWGKVPPVQPGYTSLVISALLHSGAGVTADDDVIRKPVDYLLSLQKEDGGIYTEGYINYNTSVAIMALSDVQSATKDEALKKKLGDAVDKAVKCIRGLQFKKDSGPSEGGIGYGSKNDRSDLSNTQYALDALKAAGVKEDDPVFQEALKFVERCQNSSETNPMEWAKDGVNDGGFIYLPGTPDDDPESKAGMETLPNGKKRFSSYGSMTYAGIKSLIYCGAKKDDPRLTAAFKWVSNHYDLDGNPGMPKERTGEGLFYYYQTFAKALHASGIHEIKDKDGKARNWRDDVTAKIAGLQAEDGSWKNKADRWMEGDPVLVTVYAMMSLEWAMKK